MARGATSAGSMSDMAIYQQLPFVSSGFGLRKVENCGLKILFSRKDMEITRDHSAAAQKFPIRNELGTRRRPVAIW